MFEPADYPGLQLVQSDEQVLSMAIATLRGQ